MQLLILSWGAAFGGHFVTLIVSIPGNEYCWSWGEEQWDTSWRLLKSACIQLGSILDISGMDNKKAVQMAGFETARAAQRLDWIGWEHSEANNRNNEFSP